MAVRGQIGDADVVLENAAEQATLEAILKAIDRNADQGGDGILGKATKNIIKTSFNPLGLAMKGVTGSFTLLGKALGIVTSLAGGLVKAGSGLTVLSTNIVQTQNTITDFTKIIKESGINFLGLGDALHAITELLYKDYQVFQQLSSSGIAFGDRMGTLAAQAASAGIDINQMAGLLAKNSEQLAMMGTATRGATLALGMQEQAFDKNAEMLERFGISYAEQSEQFFDFVGQNAIAFRRDRISREQIIEQSDDYAKGLRRLSELTGIQADQIKEGIDKANMNKAFENFISGMDGETANRMRSIIGTAQAAFGDSGREAAMAMMMGVAPVTEGAQNLTAMMPGFNQQFAMMTNQAKNFNGSLDDFNKMTLGSMNQFANANRAFADANSSYFGTLALMGDPYGQAGSDIVGFVNRFGGSMEEVESRMGKTDAIADAMISFNKAVADVREALGNLFKEVFKSGTFTDAMKKFAKTIRENTPAMVEAIDGIIEKIKKYNPFDKEGRENIINDAKQMWEDFKTWLQNWWETDGKQMLDKIGTTISDQINKGFNQQNGLMTEFSGNLGLTGGSDRQIKEIVEKLKAGTASDEDKDQLILWFREQKRAGMYEEGGFWNTLSAGFASITGKGLMLDYLEDLTGSGRWFKDDQDLLNMFDEILDDRMNRVDQRHFGTKAATGKVVEPANALVKIRKDERVLSPPEAAKYNANEASASSSGSANLVNKVVDSNRDSSVKLDNTLNMLIAKMTEQNNLTRQVISAVENV